MEHLIYIDTHGIEVAADLEATWRAVLRVARGAFGGPGPPGLARALRLEPASAGGAWSPEPESGATLLGFGVERLRRAELLSLRGRHRFARYRLELELSAVGSDRSRVQALTWAEFPGLAGAAYRALVIGSGAHRLVVRRMLRQIARAA